MKITEYVYVDYEEVFNGIIYGELPLLTRGERNALEQHFGCSVVDVIRVEWERGRVQKRMLVCVPDMGLYRCFRVKVETKLTDFKIVVKQGLLDPVNAVDGEMWVKYPNIPMKKHLWDFWESRKRESLAILSRDPSATDNETYYSHLHTVSFIYTLMEDALRFGLGEMSIDSFVEKIDSYLIHECESSLVHECIVWLVFATKKLIKEVQEKRIN